MKIVYNLFTIMVIACLLTGCNHKSKLYASYKYPNEDFFGKELYSEIDYQSSEEEFTIGQDVISQANVVFNYLGKDTEADDSVGELAKYYYFPDYMDTVKVTADVDLITCQETNNQYHVWAVYSVSRYDKDNNITNGSWDILTLWTCEKDEMGNVKVIDIREAA